MGNIWGGRESCLLLSDSGLSVLPFAFCTASRLIKTQWRGKHLLLMNYDYPHFTGEETEVQKGQATLPRTTQLARGSVASKCRPCTSGKAVPPRLRGQKQTARMKPALKLVPNSPSTHPSPSPEDLGDTGEVVSMEKQTNKQTPDIYLK